MKTKQINEQMEKDFDEKFIYEEGYRGGSWRFISVDNSKEIKSFIHSYTKSLLTAFAEEVIENFMKDLNYYHGDKPSCTKDQPCGCHFGEVFHADGMCLCDIEENQRLKAKEIIRSLGK